ncbi:MAG: transmission trait enhancer LetE [Legionellaceae bacterium]|nr:transmission trait enhancer LetE [Legionellaceae bacterium]
MNDTTMFLPDIKLRFNIEHPNFEESYVFGYECALADISEEENPFVAGSKESDQWIDGWWAGFYGEKPAFYLADDYEISRDHISANDHFYQEHSDHFLTKFLEISGMLVMSAIVGYQLIELVA